MGSDLINLLPLELVSRVRRALVGGELAGSYVSGQRVWDRGVGRTVEIPWMPLRFPARAHALRAYAVHGRPSPGRCQASVG